MTSHHQQQQRQISSSSSSAETFSRVEASLRSNLDELHIRNEVNECLQGMLLDVETTFSLQQQLLLESTQHALEQSETEHRATILEAFADRVERQEHRQHLADKLVVELMSTNKVLQELLEWKQAHEFKVNNYDALLAQLAQTEEELQAAQLDRYGGKGPPPRVPEQPVDSSGKNSENQAIDEKSSVPQKSDTQASTEPAKTIQPFASGDETGATTATQERAADDKGKDIAASSTMTSATSEPSTEATPAVSNQPPLAEQPVALISDVDEEKKPPAVSLETDQQHEKSSPIENGTSGDPSKAAADDTAAAPAPAVVLLEEEEKVVTNDDEPPPSLVNVDVEILMDIFGFLDAMDILNTAQINMEMYNKVDNIFGISEDGQTPPAPTPPTPAPAPKPEPTPSTSAATASTTNPATAGTSKHTPTASASSTDSGGPLGKALFSMLQPKPATSSSLSPGREASKVAGAAASAVASVASAASTSSLYPQKSQPQPQQQQQPLNARVAQSMASKLNDSELAAIISMTDKLSKADKEVNALRNEKEILSAKLDGTEAVKEFLVRKVRDVELKLARSREDEIKVTQQIASDQEVIAFLDSRVQELEQVTENLTSDKGSTQKELESLKVSTSKKITMLSDMLKYEREKLREDEGDWKATKKVLVKEVKSCRAQILTLQAERDGLMEQNEMLKRAVVSSGSASKGSNNGSSGTPTRRRKYT